MIGQDPICSLSWLSAIRIYNWWSSNLIQWPPWNTEIFFTLIPALEISKHLKSLALWEAKNYNKYVIQRVLLCSGCVLKPNALTVQSKSYYFYSNILSVYMKCLFCFLKHWAFSESSPSVIDTCQQERVIIGHKGRSVHLRRPCGGV